MHLHIIISLSMVLMDVLTLLYIVLGNVPMYHACISLLILVGTESSTVIY